jgi:hypothetical protein
MGLRTVVVCILLASGAIAPDTTCRFVGAIAPDTTC